MKEISQGVEAPEEDHGVYDESPETGHAQALGAHVDNPKKPRTDTENVITVLADCEACSATGKVTDDFGSEDACPDCQGTGRSDEVLQRWKVAPLELRIKGQFELWVQRGAKLAIQQADLYDGADESNRLRSVYVGDFGAGHYSWDGKHVRSARNDSPGIMHLLYLLIRRCHPKVTETQVRDLFLWEGRQCGTAFAWALGNGERPSAKTKI